MKNFLRKLYNDRQQQQGFTLVELVLYIGISSVVLFATSLFLSTLLAARIKNQTIAEVEQQGLYVMTSITQALRNADTIGAPTQGASAASLTIHTYPGASDPTIFDLSGGTIRITEGSNAPIALSNSRVIASVLTFQNFSRTNTPGTIRIAFTLSHLNPSGRNEYSFTKNFYGSASLRQP